jgi:hypothetical protein
MNILAASVEVVGNGHDISFFLDVFEEARPHVSVDQDHNDGGSSKSGNIVALKKFVSVCIASKSDHQKEDGEDHHDAVGIRDPSVVFNLQNRLLVLLDRSWHFLSEILSTCVLRSLEPTVIEKDGSTNACCEEKVADEEVVDAIVHRKCRNCGDRLYDFEKRRDLDVNCRHIDIPLSLGLHDAYKYRGHRNG